MFFSLDSARWDFSQLDFNGKRIYADSLCRPEVVLYKIWCKQLKQNFYK